MSLRMTVLPTGRHRLATATSFHAILRNLIMLDSIAKEESLPWSAFTVYQKTNCCKVRNCTGPNNRNIVTVTGTFIARSPLYTRFGTNNYWLGMRRNTSTGMVLAARKEDWHWLDGTSLDFHYWHVEEPSQNAQCAVITATGHWSHAYCSGAHRFICKKAILQPSLTTTTTAKPETTATTPTTTIRPTATTTTTVSKQPTQGVTPGSTLDISGLTNSSKMTSISMTTVPSHNDPSEAKQDDVTSLSDTSIGRLVLTTPRQDRQVGTGNSDEGLYIGVAAGCVVAVVAAVVVGCILCRRKKSKANDSVWVRKPYTEPDSDYVYAQNEAPNSVEAGPADNTHKSVANRSRAAYESIHIENLGVCKDDSANSDGQIFDVTQTAVILHGYQQRTMSPSATDNTPQDVADIYSVPIKKKIPSPQGPESQKVDHTEIELQGNYLYQNPHDEEFVDDEIVVENDL